MTRYLIIILTLFCLAGCTALPSAIYFPTKEGQVRVEHSHEGDELRTATECKACATLFQYLATDQEVGGTLNQLHQFYVSEIAAIRSHVGMPTKERGE